MTKQEAFRLVPDQTDETEAKRKAEMTFREERLASAIGKAVMDAVKEMQQPAVVVDTPKYLTKKQVAEFMHKSAATADNIIREIREQVEKGRYDSYAVLEGCGTMLNYLVLVDYLSRRKALRDPVACRYVPPYDAAAVREALAQ